MDTSVYLLLRIAIGTSIFGHGLVRLPKLSAFSTWMVNGFEHSLLPKALVLPFSYALPIAEFLVGLLLIAGLFTRPALIIGAAMMIILILGTTLIENWEALPSQLIHVLFLTILLQFIQQNNWALDNIIKK
ncbi:thiosulfate dehydrogenase [quinone] large subunit [Chitinophaga sp. CF118]|uniref:DoxX family protein n=1 Tax=Chitinophaga sp. CF118 TaxID=1884367 RepID=UPI0008E320AF|nr:DoxX family membrane protein [Chitinophaga sp. CF118]SFF03621.1 thiosulfate dehydrogenase [quinone] large subunit [Chitinophaga sp. CF118]